MPQIVADLVGTFAAIIHTMYYIDCNMLFLWTVSLPGVGGWVWRCPGVGGRVEGLPWVVWCGGGGCLGGLSGGGRNLSQPRGI